MNEVYDFLKKCNTYYIATVEGDQPRVRAFGTIDIFNDKLHIQTGKKKNVYAQMIANPNIEICAFGGGEWIRVAAKAIEDDSIEAEKHMLDAYPSLHSLYQPGDGNNVVFALTDVTATFFSFKGEPRTITF